MADDQPVFGLSAGAAFAPLAATLFAAGPVAGAAEVAGALAGALPVLATCGAFAGAGGGTGTLLVFATVVVVEASGTPIGTPMASEESEAPATFPRPTLLVTTSAPMAPIAISVAASASGFHETGRRGMCVTLAGVAVAASAAGCKAGAGATGMGVGAGAIGAAPVAATAAAGLAAPPRRGIPKRRPIDSRRSIRASASRNCSCRTTGSFGRSSASTAIIGAMRRRTAFGTPLKRATEMSVAGGAPVRRNQSVQPSE